MAKLFASETAMQIALDAMRIHGGYGYSTEFDVERYFRDAPLMIVGEGTNEIQRNVIARELVEAPHPPITLPLDGGHLAVRARVTGADRFAKAAASGARRDHRRPRGRGRPRAKDARPERGRPVARPRRHGLGAHQRRRHPWHHDDLALPWRDSPGLRGVVLPKAEDRRRCGASSGQLPGTRSSRWSRRRCRAPGRALRRGVHRA